MIPLVKPIFEEEEMSAVQRVLRSGMLVQGPEVENFENEFADYCGVKHAVALNSGTAAIHAMLVALGLGPGDQVITSPFTFVASASAIMMTGATPVFADIDPLTFNLCPHSVSESVNPKTKAILAVHLFGLMSDMTQLQLIADKHGIPLLEDAAQAVGARLNGKSSGSMGRMGAFSTYATKNMTTGEGGLVTTDDTDLAEFVRRFRQHGQPPNVRYVYEHLGYNYRMMDMSAAIGRVQLKKVDLWNERRRTIAHRYNNAFKEITNVVLPHTPPEFEHVHHLYSMRVLGNREEFQRILARFGVSSGVYYPTPLYKTKLFSNSRSPQPTLPVCEEICSQVLAVPCHPALTNEQVDEVIGAVRTAAEAL